MSVYPPDGSRPWWRDWQPWIEPAWTEWQQQALQQADNTACLPAVLNRFSQAAPVQFVSQAALPDGQSYEGLIFEHRQVPTRDNLHDFFNACCWRRFPLTKLRLNALQAEVIGRDGVGSTRGPLRDALTLFDENVLLLQSPPARWEALQRHDWNTLLVTHRQDWLASGSIRPLVFGHALLEKLCQPYKSITAHAFWIDPQVPATTQAWDAWLAERLTAPFMATKPFQPLPVMGIPGWCADNADPAFYADQQVFRPPPTRR